MSNTSNKIIWARINLLAPLLHLTAEEYKLQLAVHGAKRDNGSLANLSSVEAAAVLELTVLHARQLNVDLTVKINSKVKKGYNPQFDKLTPEYRMANKVKAIARSLGWEINGKLDVDKLNNWCVRYSAAKKELHKHNYQELVQLITQIEKLK